MSVVEIPVIHGNIKSEINGFSAVSCHAKLKSRRKKHKFLLGSVAVAWIRFQHRIRLGRALESFLFLYFLFFSRNSLFWQYVRWTMRLKKWNMLLYATEYIWVVKLVADAKILLKIILILFTSDTRSGIHLPTTSQTFTFHAKSRSSKAPIFSCATEPFRTVRFASRTDHIKVRTNSTRWRCWSSSMQALKHLCPSYVLAYVNEFKIHLFSFTASVSWKSTTKMGLLFAKHTFRVRNV